MLVEYTSWRSWDRCIHFHSFPEFRKLSGKKAPPQMTTKIQYPENKELETVCWNLSKKTVQEHRIILAAELEETKNHLSAQTKINYVSPQPSSTLSKPSTMKLLMELASVSKKLNQHQPWFPEGNEVEPGSWLSTVIYWPEPRSTGCSILCTPTGNPARKPDNGGDP